MLENNIFFFDSTCMHEKNPVKWGDFGNSTVTLGGTELLQNKHYKYNLPVFVYSFLVALLSIALFKRWLLLGSSDRFILNFSMHTLQTSEKQPLPRNSRFLQKFGLSWFTKLKITKAYKFNVIFLLNSDRAIHNVLKNNQLLSPL